MTQPNLNPAQIVFLGESGFCTNMARRMGRSPRGQRLVAAVPHGHWKMDTLVAGLRADGIVAPLVIDQPAADRPQQGLAAHATQSRRMG